MEIVVLDSYCVREGDLDWSPLYALADRVTLWPRTPRGELARRIGGAECVISNHCRIDGEVLDACPGLRWIGLTSTGTDSLDLAACARRGVKVANVPGYSTESVAQHTFALLLEAANGVARRAWSLREGWWQAGVPERYGLRPPFDLAGRTFGAVGYGAIGAAAVRIARGCGMRAAACTRTPRAAEPGVEFMSLDELLAASDVVSLHCPATPATRGMIGPAQLERMKPGTVLINTARGSLIDEAAVAAAAQAGRIFYAADVAAREPIRPENPLLAADNVLLTPHVAWATGEALERLAAEVCENLRAYLAGRPHNLVN